MAEYFKPYVDGLSQYETATPEFVDRIIYPKQFLTVKNVVQILSLMRFDALKYSDTDTVIEHLSYFINFLKNRYNVTSGIFRKCAIKYSDYAKNFSRVLHFAMETFVPPIILTVDTVEEWESFKSASKEIDYHDEKYPCQYTGINFSHKTYSVDEINHFGADMFPIEIRVDAQKKFDNAFLASDSSYVTSKNELHDQLNEIVPKEAAAPTPSIFKKHWLLLTSFAVSLIVLLGLIFWPEKVNTDVPDWMVGKWIGDMVYVCDNTGEYYTLEDGKLPAVELGSALCPPTTIDFTEEVMKVLVLDENQIVKNWQDTSMLIKYQDRLSERVVRKESSEFELIISKNGKTLFVDSDTTEIHLSYYKDKKGNSSLTVSGDEKIANKIQAAGGLKLDATLEILSIGNSVLAKEGAPVEEEIVEEVAKEEVKEILYLSVVEEETKNGETIAVVMLATSADSPAVTARYDRDANLLYFYDEDLKAFKEVDMNNYTVDMSKLSDDKAYVTMRRK